MGGKGKRQDKMLNQKTLGTNYNEFLVFDYLSCRHEGDDLEPSHKFHGVRPIRSYPNYEIIYLYLLLLV